jgi:predicted small secreted protein
MEALSDNFVGMIAIILGLGLPIIAVIMMFVQLMKKNRLDKEVRQLIIENHTDTETAKLLIDEPKKAPKRGTLDLGTLRTAAILLGIGLGTLIDWLAGIGTKSIYFLLIIAFGVGIGMLCSFLVEMYLYEKEKKNKDNTVIIEN